MVGRDDIIRMVRQAGGYLSTEGVNWMPIISREYAEKFAALVAAHERRACGLIVLDNSDADGICCTDDVLEAFRQRGEK
jgi:hypothetical protein